MGRQLHSSGNRSIVGRWPEVPAVARARIFAWHTEKTTHDNSVVVGCFFGEDPYDTIRPLQSIPSLSPMTSDVTRRGRVRPLYEFEIEEARLVFADRLPYERIRVHEFARWPDALDRLGRWLKRMPHLETHNAITLGYHCFFPVGLPETFTRPDDPTGMSWLVHELTHAWQFQQLGWRYLWLALAAQFREGAKAYDFGGPKGLDDRRREKWTLHKFNMEQQGDIAREYYIRHRTGQEVTAWLPYIKDIQGTA